MKKPCMTMFALCVVAFCATAGENLLRDDFVPDNLGGVLGWTAHYITPVKVKITPLAPEKPGEKGGIRITWRDARRFSIRSTLRLGLVRGQRYRISADVRTHGIQASASCITLADMTWGKGQGLDGLPGDTHGEWKKVSWEGVLDLPSRTGDYVCMFAAAAEKLGEAWVDIRSLSLEGPVKPNYDGKKQMNLKPFPLRVTPVDPLLGELRPACAEMLFYCAAASDEMRTGERKLLRATAAERTVTVPFETDGHAKAVFGPIAPGKINLRAELVGADSGKVYAANDYRAYVREQIKDATPMKRLNNFVSELTRRPYAAGDVPFTLAKDTWMYVALSDVDAKVEAAFDGKPAKFYPDSGRLEIMRRMPRGSHVLSLKGSARGELVVRALKDVSRSGMEKSEKMLPNFEGYGYGPEFFDAFELYGGFNMSGSGPEAVNALLQERGVDVGYGCGLKPRDSRRGVLEDYIAYPDGSSGVQGWTPLRVRRKFHFHGTGRRFKGEYGRGVVARIRRRTSARRVPF